MGNSWIDPVGSTLSWAPFLYWMVSQRSKYETFEISSVCCQVFDASCNLTELRVNYSGEMDCYLLCSRNKRLYKSANSLSVLCWLVKRWYDSIIGTVSPAVGNETEIDIDVPWVFSLHLYILNFKQSTTDEYAVAAIQNVATQCQQAAEEGRWWEATGQSEMKQTYLINMCKVLSHVTRTVLRHRAQ